MSKLIVKCPTCGKSVTWAPLSVNRPFCSERCKLIDLGEWASGNRYISTDADHDDVTASDLDRD